MKPRYVGMAALSLTAFIGAGLLLGKAAGLRLNTTDSAPHGLWLVQTTGSKVLERGELVEICPPLSPVVRIMASRGYLPAGECAGVSVAPLLKPLSAIAGDTIRLRQGEPVMVNGVALPNTVAMPSIPAWPDGIYKVQPGQAWLFSSYSAGSFDSRYFGPVELAAVRGIASAVAVDGDTAAITTGVRHQ
jgi:conjugative transfer signal peptidase TraF